jgi:hypothetical protein
MLQRGKTVLGGRAGPAEVERATLRSFDASVAEASNTGAAFPGTRSIGINPNGLLRAFQPMRSRVGVTNEI